jgi:DNA repair protein RecN (Recombination protein N)
MLQSLSIRNFVLIEELELDLKEGLSVITGETGAGKSILIDAILFCLGSKFSSNIIKTGADFCSVTAVFTPSDDVSNLLNEINIEHNDELIVKCIQMHGNRRKFLINDQIVTQKTLQQVTDYLLELHGQHNHTSLINPSTHIDILDNYGDLLDLRSSVSELYKNWQKIKKEIVGIKKEKDNIESEISYLTFVVDELAKLDIKLGEEEKLSNIRRNLQNRDKEIKEAQDLLAQLELPDIDQAISKGLRIIARSSSGMGDYSSISLNLEEAYNNLEDARTKIRSIINNYNTHEFNLEEIEDRLFEIRDKARKYGVISDELPNFLKESNEQLETFQKKISNSEKLEKDLLRAIEQYFNFAKILSNKRANSAITLERIVQSELALLKMEKAIFRVEINTLEYENLTQGEAEEEIFKNGIDSVRFIASINPGTPAAPIDKIASGGELSRFMLALKAAILRTALRPTIIFDEIDTGIGGVVADSVGQRLKKLGRAAQVIAITHQPQVAGKADQHILVEKTQLDKKTKVIIRSLSKEERVLELARMISGKAITESSIKAAQELLVINEL